MILSFVIPAFNIQECIIRTLDSIFQQNSPDIEVIVVDDGSSDLTFSYVERYKIENGLINLHIIQQKNAGVSVARNVGLARAKGQYVLFLDGDDLISADFVKIIIDELKTRKPDIVYWPYNKIDEKGNTIWEFPYKAPPTNVSGEEYLLLTQTGQQEAWICTGSAAYRRAMLQENMLIYREGCVSGEDIEFIFSSLLKAENVYFINRLLSEYLQRSGSATNKFSIRKFDSVYSYQRIIDRFVFSDNPNIVLLATTIRHCNLVHNYLTNYSVGLRQLAKERKIGLADANNFLTNQLKATYPGMQEKMNSLMSESRSYHRKGKIRLFQLSPILYTVIRDMFK